MTPVPACSVTQGWFSTGGIRPEERDSQPPTHWAMTYPGYRSANERITEICNSLRSPGNDRDSFPLRQEALHTRAAD